MRECCGANGFSKYSSFHTLIATCSPGVTLEGDSVVMNLQTARALLKNGRQVLIKNKPLNKTLSYIEELKTLDPNVCCAAADGDRVFFSNEQNLVNLLKHSALLAISNCLQMFANPKYKGFSAWEKFYQTFQIDLIRMANQHSYFMAANFALRGILNLGVDYDQNTVAHLKRMLRLFCLNALLKQSAPLAITQYFKPFHFKQIQAQYNQELSDLKPQALNLIECFEFDDNVICSAIGSYDGQVNERMLACAKASKLNNKDVLDGFKDYIQPILKNDLQSLKAKL